jgi:hypothetical protein
LMKSHIRDRLGGWWMGWAVIVFVVMVLVGAHGFFRISQLSNFKLWVVDSILSVPKKRISIHILLGLIIDPISLFLIIKS